MNNVLTNNSDTSTIIDILKTIPYENLHSHTISKNYANNFRTVENISFKKNLNTYVFKLPKSGFLQNIILNVKGSVPIRNKIFIGVRIFNSISLMQNGKVIFTNTPAYSISRLNTLKPEGLKSIADDYGCDNTFDTVCPIFASMFDKSGNNLLLSYVSELELHCELNSFIELDDFKCKAFIINYEEEYYNNFIYTEFRDPFKNYFSYDSFEITTLTVPNSTSTTVQLNSLFFCFAIHNLLFDYNFSYVPIHSIELWFNDKKVFQISSSENYLLSNSYFKEGFSYFFGIEDRSFKSGGVSLNSNWTLVVNHDPSPYEFQLKTVIEYYVILQLNKNGLFNRQIIY